MTPTPIDRARRLAAEVLAPTAQATDRAGAVPAGHIALLGEAGLLGLGMPEDVGGTPCTPAEARAVHRVLGGACGSTALLWAQHQHPLTLLAATPNRGLRDRWLAPLCRGHVLGSAAFAHLRVAGTPPVQAVPTDHGWLVHGETRWVPGGGRTAVFAVAAYTPAGDVLWVLVDPSAVSGFTVSDPVPLMAMSGAVPVRLRFDAMEVSADDVLLEVPPEMWWGMDDVRAARRDPAAAGVADTALALLATLGADASRVGEPLAQELLLLDQHDARVQAAADVGDVDLHALGDARAQGFALAHRTAAALLDVVGPDGLGLDHPAQRLVREAAFVSAMVSPLAAPTRAGSPAVVAVP